MKKSIQKSLKFNFFAELKKKYPAAQVYLVGGAVRDLLLKNKTADLDLVICGVPISKLEIFLKKYGAVKLAGKRFGVFKFKPKGEIQFKTHRLTIQRQKIIDIALPRTDQSLGTGRHQDFTVQSNANLPIEEDLRRRDFTINALALNLPIKNKIKLNQQIIDPFSGQQDLKKKIIRTVGNAEERFSEDFCRMLRAIRFACQLNFKIEAKTWQNIKKLAKNILEIPKESIAGELKKMFAANILQALNLLEKAGFLEILIPEILKMKTCPQPKNFHSEGNVFKHTKTALKILQEKKIDNIELILAVLLHDIGKPYKIKRPGDLNYPAPKKGPRRIKFPKHDKFGAMLTRRILKRLKMSSTKVNVNETAWLVGNHMLPYCFNLKTVKNTTLEKYFFNPKYSGWKLLKIIECDSLASIKLKSGRPDLTKFFALRKKINRLKKIRQTKKEPQKTLLNGYEIMDILKIKSGPEIGKILARLREEELSGRLKTKKEARDWLLENLKFFNHIAKPFF